MRRYRTGIYSCCNVSSSVSWVWQVKTFWRHLIRTTRSPPLLRVTLTHPKSKLSLSSLTFLPTIWDDWFRKVTACVVPDLGINIATPLEQPPQKSDRNLSRVPGSSGRGCETFYVHICAASMART